jgi:hypothetical protein
VKGGARSEKREARSGKQGAGSKDIRDYPIPQFLNPSIPLFKSIPPAIAPLNLHYSRDKSSRNINWDHRSAY